MITGNERMRARGFRQCLMTVTRDRKAAEYESGQKPVSKAGWQCRKMVPPDQIKKLGVPICHMHEKIFLSSMEQIEKKRLEMRAKYDPGPLPL